ncbi:PEP/pyruvate-binding domain-containing protein [Haloferula chungangensis]|uniref:PEP/pyruvate-binding domain-containing protein n=1 Tax=Haloferula chungangensis TaxID=1048331 RepID=A0ABW2L4E1_9BACT
MIIPLAEAATLELAGGKAVNLARLISAGLPVPGGFVVTTAAYRQASGDCEIPADIAAQIREAYERMGSPMVAARSSATAEDMPDASMAGQYETFLNLTGADALLDAVSRCWKSMRSERLRAYLREQGIVPESVAMAVVVQELVPADLAGVLFTADPQTGSTDDMLVEAAWGLGEGVVSGTVQPDRVRLRASDGQVLDYHVAEKLTRLAPGGQDFEEVPENERRRACLRSETLHRLWELGRQAERHFGGPQDIEWAVVSGEVRILQSRNITTLREAALRHGRPAAIRKQLEQAIADGHGPWVRHNMDETLPNPTPLTWSLIGPFMSGDGGFGKMHRLVGFEPSPAVANAGFLDLIGGRLYMDCSRMPEMFAAAYPFAYDPELLRTNPDAAQQPPTLVKGSLKAQAEAAKLGVSVTDNLRKQAVDLDQRFDKDFIPAVTAWCAAQDARDLSALSDAELITFWDAACSTVLDDFGVTAFLPSMIEALATADLLAFLEEHAWDDDPDSLLHQLVVGQSPDQTFLSNIRLQELAQGKLSRADWLKDFGDRGPGEFDLASPRWNERPQDLEALSARLANETPLTELHEKRRKEADEALENLRASLSPELADELGGYVDLASRYVRFREDGKHYLMLAYARLRKIALEFARRLDLGGEIFFLEADEISEALLTGFVPMDRIAHRKHLRNADKSLSLPRVIEESDLATLGLPCIASDATAWAAHPLSPGTSTGPARIVHSPDSAGDLGDDYILICPSTDPSWTPLFIGASGLILERGGMLSHGAIVARELGLPSVVLDDATQLFKDGETLTLDAVGGRVIRGAAETASNNSENTSIERALQPPPPGKRERQSNRRGLIFALLWAVFLAAVWFLPPAILQDPIFGALDVILWPLVATIGMPGTVAVIAGFFAILPLVLQKFFTDNERLMAARDRSAKLRKLALDLPSDSPRREAMNMLAAPVTMRVLKAAMTSLAFVLGPMMLVFLWLPARLDPASWNAETGQTVTVLAEVSGDWQSPLELRVPEPLSIDPIIPATQTLPPIRETLEELRAEWSQASDTSEYPWEIQAASDHVREVMLGSLNRYLAGEIPAQKLSWRVVVPEGAEGHHLVSLHSDGSESVPLTLAFGNAKPPELAETLPSSGPISLLKVVYPRALVQNKFWAPFGDYDFGWLGVYLLAYLPIMIIAKKLLKVA